MTKIHPTAIVDEEAQLGENVVIGPYCVVGRDVQIGAGTILEAHVVISPGVRIGKNNTFSPGCAIGGLPQVLGLNAETKIGTLQIGDGNAIRELVTIHRSRFEGRTTQIGSGNLLMVGCHIGHDGVVEDKTVISNGVQIGGHCRIETGAWLSGMAGTHQFVTVGKWGFLAGLTGLTRDAPPFMITSGHYPSKVRGVNKRGLQRAGLDEQRQRNIDEAYHKLYRQGGALLENVHSLAQEDGLDENVHAIIDSIIRSSQHRFGRYLETLRAH